VLDARDAVAEGMMPHWPDFRPADDGIARQVWTLRQAARKALGGRTLDLDALRAVRSAGIAERVRPVQP
jgi:phosphopantetheinyl transferase